MAPTCSSPNSLETLVNAILVQLRGLSPGLQTLRGSECDRNGSPLPDEARPYLLTLHLLYPHLLLDALDLLDRGLVTRLCIAHRGDERRGSSMVGINAGTDNNDSDTRLRAAILADMDAADAQPSTITELASESPRSPAGPRQSMPGMTSEHAEVQHAKDLGLRRVAFHVASAQAPHHRSGISDGVVSSSAVSQSYQVFLRAWHCSCPAFAHDAFAEENRIADAALATAQTQLQHLALGVETEDLLSLGLPSTLAFGFGGLPAWRARLRQSLRPVDFEGDVTKLPPLCKHLLACVLAEAAPGLFVAQEPTSHGGNTDPGLHEPMHRGMRGALCRWISREEAAGWAAGSKDW